MSKDKRAVKLNDNGQEHGAENQKWHWRPGMRPRVAFTVGVLFSVVGLLFVVLGVVSFIAGIQDSHSAPIQVPGIVTGYTTNLFDNLPHVIIRVKTESTSTTIAPAVSHAIAQSLHNGDTIIVDYAHRLNVPYALEIGGQQYLLPGTSSAGNPFGSIALVILGLIIFPYPALLATWGWRDLQTQHEDIMMGQIVELRSSKQTRTPQPGITSPISRSTYTMVIEPIRASVLQDVITFSIKEEMYRTLRMKTLVQISYSPNLHYVYAVKQVDDSRK
ncbi:MAG: hypothetical protein ACXVCM_02040 [Ktedonobacteraceae bacterium]